MQSFDEIADAAKTGMTTGDSERFLRLWHEVVLHETIVLGMPLIIQAKQYRCKWFPYNKGGGFVNGMETWITSELE